MNNILESKRFWYLVICWTARVIAGLLAALMLTITIGEAFIYPGDGLPNPFTQPLSVAIELFAMLGILLGLIIGFKWQLIGGILIIAGSIVFHIIEGKILMGWLSELWELVGILYLICWHLKRVSKNVG